MTLTINIFFKVNSVNFFKESEIFPVKVITFNTTIRHLMSSISFISSGNNFKIVLANFFSAFLKIAFCSVSNFDLTEIMHSRRMHIVSLH